MLQGSFYQAAVIKVTIGTHFFFFARIVRMLHHWSNLWLEFYSRAEFIQIVKILFVLTSCQWILWSCDVVCKQAWKTGWNLWKWGRWCRGWWLREGAHKWGAMVFIPFPSMAYLGYKVWFPLGSHTHLISRIPVSSTSSLPDSSNALTYHWKSGVPFVEITLDSTIPLVILPFTVCWPWS